MVRAVGTAALLAVCATCGFGCASERALVDRSAGAGLSPCTFWPPPPSTAVALTRSELHPQPGGLRGIADRIATVLRTAGYAEPRWYPIGLDYVHGFAATTRLEAVNDDASPRAESDRWSSVYPDAATLRWLTLARKVSLPYPGRYRVFLIAVTDLPLGGLSAIAPAWNQDTVMDGPGVRVGFPSTEQTQNVSGYRLGVYVYQYDRPQELLQGEFTGAGAEWSAAAQLQGARLSHLSESPLVNAY